MHSLYAAFALLGLTACTQQGSAPDNRATQIEETSLNDEGHYDRPPALSIDGAELRLEGTPPRWRIGSPGFTIRIGYRQAPPNAGLMVYVSRDVPMDELRNFPSSGGGLTAEPIAIEGSGVLELRFEGTAFSAPADYPQSFPLQRGRHIIVAQMLNHRRLVIGYVRRDPSDRVLAEAHSDPISIDD